MRKAILLATAAIAMAGCQKTNGGNETTAAAPDAVTQYQIDQVTLPGEGRGDYITVDSDAGRLYVTHTGSVHILDLATLKPIGELTGLKKAHGVALDAAHGRGFASDGDGNQVVMFDLATSKAIKTIKTGENPDSILRDPASGMIFVFNGTTKDISVIDPGKGEVVKTIPLGDKPEYSQADGKGKVWVALEDSGAIAEIDSKTMTVAKTYKLPDCEGPAPLALDAANRRLFTACGNHQMKVVNADTGAVVATLPVGKDPDGIVYDAEKRRIYVANRDGTMTIANQSDADTYTLDQNLKSEEYAKTAALDPKTHRIFSSTADLIWPKEVPGKKLLPDAKSGTFRLLVISEK